MRMHRSNVKIVEADTPKNYVKWEDVPVGSFFKWLINPGVWSALCFKLNGNDSINIEGHTVAISLGQHIRVAEYQFKVFDVEIAIKEKTPL